MLLHILNHHHESSYWSVLGLSRVFDRQLEAGTKLFPVCWAAFAPGSGRADGQQWFGDCPEVCSTSLCSPRVLLQNVLLCFGDPVCPLLCCFIGWIVVQTKFVSLALVRCPWSKVDVRDFGQSWEMLDLAVLTSGCLNVKGQGEQCMWSPRDGPVSGQSSGAGQLIMQQPIIQDIT